MGNRNDHIDRLIVRYFSGEALPEEAFRLEQWIDESPENKKYFEGFRFIIDKAGTEKKYNRVDTVKAWEKVSYQMKKEKEAGTDVEKVTIPLLKTRWFRMVASIMLLIGFSMILLIYSSGKNRYLPPVTIASSDSPVSRKLSHQIQVSLNINTRVDYLTNKTGKKNELKIEGEAFIEVQHSADTVLIVHAGETFIRDIGTSFNVKAYPDAHTVEVCVESGVVSFYTKEQKGIDIKKGETGVYDKSTRQFTLRVTSDTIITAYKTGSFEFRNTKLSDVIKAFNDLYPQKIILADSALADYTITVTFKNEPIDSLVNILAETLGLKVRRDSSDFVLQAIE